MLQDLEYVAVVNDNLVLVLCYTSCELYEATNLKSVSATQMPAAGSSVRAARRPIAAAFLPVCNGPGSPFEGSREVALAGPPASLPGGLGGGPAGS